MMFPPGSFLWLLRHDLRLSWRQMTQVIAHWTPRTSALFVSVSLLVAHLLAWGAFGMRQSNPGLFGAGALATGAIGALLWMIAQGLLGATRSLYERGSLELLFASPQPEWKAVAARAAGIAGASFLALAPIMLPLANAGALRDGPAWLAMYPILAALALSGTAIGLIVAIVLFQFAGARRARQISQILAAVIAGGFVLVVQLGLLLPKEFTAGVITWLLRLHADALVHFDLPAVITQIRVDAVSLTLMLMGSMAVFAASVAAFSGAFARAALTAAGIAEGPASASASGRPFREGAGASLRLKEWRLLVRDPNLFAQLGLQIIYTLPLAVLLLRSPEHIPPAIALTPLIVVLAAQIAASLAWITVSGEDAPELLATAPIAVASSSRAKLSAIALPLAVILALPLLALATISIRALIYAVVFGSLAASSTALLNFWHPIAGSRRGLLRRHSQSKVIAVAEHGLALLWAVCVVTALVDLTISLIPMTVIAGILWLFMPKTNAGAARSAVAALFAFASRAKPEPC